MDMLVKLYNLPSLEAEFEKMEEQGIRIIRALPPNRNQVVEWVRTHTSEYAAGEAECAFSNSPATIFLAVRGDEILGYACYNATAPDYFGPTEVKKECQGKGIGRALLIAAMHALKSEGYGYAIIGGVGHVDFYKKTVGAVEIEDSTPGLYANMLKLT